MSWKLTIRQRSDVDRARFESLEEAIAEMRRRAEQIKAEGPLEDVSMIRSYSHEVRVHARLELSGSGIRRPEAGLDVMGDGRLVPYRGAIFKRELESSEGGTVYDSIREALAR